MSNRRLRAKAEKILKSALPNHNPELDANKLLHELHVHQIEVEMQNEELNAAKLELEVSRAHYMDLYDFAPVAYLTLNAQNIITECNLTAATLLGVQCKQLISHPLEKFVDREFQGLWYQQLRAAWYGRKQHVCELPFYAQNGEKHYFRLDCIVLSDKPELPTLRISITNITLQKNTELSLRATEAKLTIERNKYRQKLEESLRLHIAIQTVMAIAHELN